MLFVLEYLPPIKSSVSKENILRCLVHFLFFDAKGTFSAGSPVSCLLRFLRRMQKTASMIATSATRTTGTAMAAFVPADIPTLASFLVNPFPSLAAPDVDVAPFVVVPVDDEDATVLVCEEEGVDDVGVVSEDVTDEIFDNDEEDGLLEVVVGSVDVVNVEGVVFLVLLLLSSDCSDARMEDALPPPGVGREVGKFGVFSLMAVKAAAMVEVPMPDCNVNGGEEEGP